MRGRWASAALGAGIARRRAAYEMDQQTQAFETQQAEAQRQKTNRTATAGRPVSEVEKVC